jgi:D-alanyl-D-alanine dipeptidase
MNRSLTGAILLCALVLLSPPMVSAADFPCGQLTLVTLPARAAQPRMVQGVAERWQAARVQINAALGYAPGSSGYDWLATAPSDMLRDIAFRPTQSNQILYSWHKTGRAVDIPQTGPGLTHVADPAAPGYELFFLRSATGEQINITAIMQAHGFARIPSSATRPEWWHFEVRDGLSWQGAMSQIYTTAQLQAVYPELNWSSFSCTGPDPVEPASGEDGGVSGLEAIPDLVSYVSFALPDPSSWWPVEPPPPSPDDFDFIGQALYPFQWLGWLIRMALRESVVIAVALAQYGANFLALAINTVLLGINGLWRLAIVTWLGGKLMFYAVWSQWETLRQWLNDAAGWLIYVQTFLQVMVDVCGMVLDLVGQGLQLILSLALVVVNLVGWIAGLSIGLIISILAQLRALTAPAQLSEPHVIYRFVRGFGEGLRDSQLGWLLYLVWAMCYVACVMWLARFFSASREAS